MDKKRPFSKLKKVIDGLFDDKLKMEFCCNAVPIRGQWGQHNSIPRFYLKLDKEIIWDFPKDFEIKEIPYGYWADNNNISDLVRDYIDTPLEKLLDHKFELENNSFTIQNSKSNLLENYDIDYKLTELFKTSDRRLGKEKLLKWAEQIKNPMIDRILKIRF